MMAPDTNAAPVAPATAPRASETTREYVVLAPRDLGDDETTENWTVAGRVTAATDSEARKMVGATLAEEAKDAPLVAVPARYWNPKKRKVTTKISESWD